MYKRSSRCLEVEAPGASFKLWPPIGKIVAHLAYDMFSHLGFWSGNLFLIAPFPDLCLLVPFHGTST